jgi:hypothetical protein
MENLKPAECASMQYEVVPVRRSIASVEAAAVAAARHWIARLETDLAVTRSDNESENR